MIDAFRSVQFDRFHKGLSICNRYHCSRRLNLPFVKLFTRRDILSPLFSLFVITYESINFSKCSYNTYRLALWNFEWNICSAVVAIVFIHVLRFWNVGWIEWWLCRGWCHGKIILWDGKVKIEINLKGKKATQLTSLTEFFHSSSHCKSWTLCSSHSLIRH